MPVSLAHPRDKGTFNLPSRIPLLPPPTRAEVIAFSPRINGSAEARELCMIHSLYGKGLARSGGIHHGDCVSRGWAARVRRGWAARVGRGLQERFTRAPVLQPGMPRPSWLRCIWFRPGNKAPEHACAIVCF